MSEHEPRLDSVSSQNSRPVFGNLQCVQRWPGSWLAMTRWHYSSELEKWLSVQPFDAWSGQLVGQSCCAFSKSSNLVGTRSAVINTYAMRYYPVHFQVLAPPLMPSIQAVDLQYSKVACPLVRHIASNALLQLLCKRQSFTRGRDPRVL